MWGGNPKAWYSVHKSEEREYETIENKRQQFSTLLDQINTLRDKIEEELERLKGTRGIELPLTRKNARKFINGAYRHLRAAERLIDKMEPAWKRQFDTERRYALKHPDLEHHQLIHDAITRKSRHYQLVFLRMDADSEMRDADSYRRTLEAVLVDLEKLP